MSLLGVYYRRPKFLSTDISYGEVPLMTATLVSLNSSNVKRLISNDRAIEMAAGVMIPCIILFATVYRHVFRNRRPRSPTISETELRVIGDGEDTERAKRKTSKASAISIRSVSHERNDGEAYYRSNIGSTIAGLAPSDDFFDGRP